MQKYISFNAIWVMEKSNIWHWDRNSNAAVLRLFTPRNLVAQTNPWYQLILQVKTYLLQWSPSDFKPSGIFFRKFACDLGFAGCQNLQIFQKSNLSQRWAREKNEQVMLGTIPTLPAPETYQKHPFLMKQCSQNEKLHATLDSQVAKTFKN